jgi:hypothetical protein
MSSAVRNRDIRAVDAFLAERKRLLGPPPEWGPSSRKGDVQAIWRIVEDNGLERAHLRFRCALSDRQHPSVSLIFRNNPIWRIDIVPSRQCKFNPPWCSGLGLPPRVCGPHEHRWSDNKHYLENEAAWNIPARRPLPPQLRRFHQIVPWFSKLIKIELEPDQHGFDVPPQTDLFNG